MSQGKMRHATLHGRLGLTTSPAIGPRVDPSANARRCRRSVPEAASLLPAGRCAPVLRAEPSSPSAAGRHFAALGAARCGKTRISGGRSLLRCGLGGGRSAVHCCARQAALRNAAVLHCRRQLRRGQAGRGLVPKPAAFSWSRHRSSRATPICWALSLPIAAVCRSSSSSEVSRRAEGPASCRFAVAKSSSTPMTIPVDPVSEDGAGSVACFAAFMQGCGAERILLGNSCAAALAAVVAVCTGSSVSASDEARWVSTDHRLRTVRSLSPACSATARCVTFSPAA